MERQSLSDKLFDIVNTVLLVIILILTLYPLIYVVSASISNPKFIMEGKIFLIPKDISFDSYKAVLRNPSILIGYRNTIFYTVAGTAINIVLTVAGAYPLSRKDFRGRNILTGIFTFTMMFNGGLIPTYMVINKLGMVNSFWVMIIPGAVSVWNMIIMRTFFSTSIPFELQEAAFIDGCSNIRMLLKIILPLSAPVIAVMVLFYGVGHWNAFFNALIYISDRRMYPLQLVLRETLNQNQVQSMMEIHSETAAEQMILAEGLKYSLIIVSSLPVLMLYPFLQRYFVKGVMVGAIKG